MVDVTWMFAYGSNMNLADLRRWMRDHDHLDVRIDDIVRATLPDHRLVWNYYSAFRRGGAANIEGAPGRRLPGIAMRVCARTRAAIDAKEGHPNVYRRTEVSIELDGGGIVTADAYIARPERCHPTPQWPTRAYLDLLISAALEHRLPDDHVAALSAIRVVD